MNDPSVSCYNYTDNDQHVLDQANQGAKVAAKDPQILDQEFNILEEDEADQMLGKAGNWCEVERGTGGDRNGRAQKIQFSAIQNHPLNHLVNHDDRVKKMSHREIFDSEVRDVCGFDCESDEADQRSSNLNQESIPVKFARNSHHSQPLFPEIQFEIKPDRMERKREPISQIYNNKIFEPIEEYSDESENKEAEKQADSALKE